MITLKQAVESVRQYVDEFGDIFPSRTTARLEETEFEKNVWKITLSFEDPSSFASAINMLRRYKVFSVNGTTGEVIAMRDRKP